MFQAMKEEWRPVSEWEHAYEVSSLGRVRSIDREKRHFCRWGERTRKIKGRVLAPVDGAYGYPVVSLCDRPRRRLRQVHILVCEAFHGPRPDGHEVGHLNGDRADPRAENLRWVTPKENQAHRKAHGTYQCGEDAAPARLRESEARDILRRYKSGERQADLARMFKVSPATVWRIIHRVTWAHIH